jgi:hypothetical protein
MIETDQSWPPPGRPVQLFPKEPENPFPVWANVCIGVAGGVASLGYYLFDMEQADAMLLASPLALVYAVRGLLWLRDEKRQQLDHIRWKIERYRIALFDYKYELEKGPQGFDGETPKDEWEFELRYKIRHAEEQLEELGDDLSRLLESK